MKINDLIIKNLLVYLASIESLSYDVSRYKKETFITKKLAFSFYSYFL